MTSITRSNFRAASLALAALLITAAAVADEPWTVADMLRARRDTAAYALAHNPPAASSRSFRRVRREMSWLLRILPAQLLAAVLAPADEQPVSIPLPTEPTPLPVADGDSIPWYGPDFVGPIPPRPVR